MSDPDPFGLYLHEIQKNVATGTATEHTHRPALQTLLETLGGDVMAINEPKRIACGAPDYIVVRGKTPVGYVEAKEMGASLNVVEKSAQMQRYRASLNNLILTDYLEFRWYVAGERRALTRLATMTQDGKIKAIKGGVQAVADLFLQFFAQQAPRLDNPRDLAQRMADLARLIRNLIEETFKQEEEAGALHAQLKAFRDTLIPDLGPAQFADMYAQTITYGLFAARLRVPNGQPFTREQAAWNLPRTNPFLRKLFNEIAGPDLDERVAWLVDDLAHLLDRAEIGQILQHLGRRTKQQDPTIHFYETFLAAYDPTERQRRGVYYTPAPVVSYIVRSLDHIIKTHFDRPLGLADPTTLILDPAVGTATFLYFVIQHVYETMVVMGQAGSWNNYVADRLLPRLFGFELLMAPYAMAHVKLGIALQETGYDFADDRRLGIYLTNTLEEAIAQAHTLGFARFITEEANAAAEIKRIKPIMVVLGNPPYAKCSANRGPHANDLLARYKAAVRTEGNIQPLYDDYIKFIRFAHDRIERTGCGVIGMITNHTYLSGLIHRGMREELLKSFSEIYVLNLHGSALQEGPSSHVGQDENVFDIRQGVAIGLFVRRIGHTGLARVHYADLWGAREGKYRYLAENDVSTTTWQTLAPASPHFFFVPKDFSLLTEYERGWRVPDIFPLNSSGVKTHRDHFALDFDEQRLRARIAAFRDKALSDSEAREKFRLEDTRDWKLAEARARLQARDDWEKNLTSCLYRPFDVRPIYYSADVIELPRLEVMRHMLAGRNIGLIADRTTSPHAPFTHVFASERIVDVRMLPDYGGAPYLFPLYVYNEKQEKPMRGGGAAIALLLFDSRSGYSAREPNLSPQFIGAVQEKLGLDFVRVGKGDGQRTFGPEDVFHYAYAVFHSPTYRRRYAEFLKIDFPRLPLTSDLALFRSLAEKGEELVALHLMESPTVSRLITRFPEAGSNVVEKVRYVEPIQETQTTPDDDHEPRSRMIVIAQRLPLFEQLVEVEIKPPEQPRPSGRVYINKTQYFEGIDPEVWAFEIGGYQVLDKWLKDRQGRVLKFDDLFWYQKTVVALKETLRLMQEIDGLIPAWPIQ